MHNQVMWDIRDARGLTAAQKAILWAVESRGSAFSTIETLSNDAGMSRSAFYEHRDLLIEEGLLRCVRRFGERQKVYTVDADVLREFVPAS